MPNIISVSPKLKMLLWICALVPVVIVFFYSKDNTYKPIAEYDFSTFSENKKLSADFTEAFRHVLNENEDTPWFKMRRRVYPKVPALQLKEMRLNLLNGFKSKRYVGYEFFFKDGHTESSWTDGRDHYFGPLVVFFNDDASLTIHTNGDEKNLDYEKNRHVLMKNFEDLLYSGLYHLYSKTEEFRREERLQAQKTREEETQQQETNKKTWE